MAKSSRKMSLKRPSWGTIIMIIIIATTLIISSIVLYTLFFAGSPNTGIGFSDPRNDVVLNIGADYPSMIDVTYARLEANKTELKITITIRGPISSLNPAESAQWNITLALTLQNDDLAAYEIWAELNSTQLSGHIVEMGGSNATACQVETRGTSITLRAQIPELQTTKEVQWDILTTYEKTEDELVASASDTAPDEGFQMTSLR